MYSTHKEEKSISIKSKYIYIYIDKLADTVIKYSNTYHSTTKMKPIDGKSSTCIDCKRLHSKLF